MRFVLPFVLTFAAAVATSAASGDPAGVPFAGAQSPPTLSAFGFFDGSAARPSSRLIPYELRTPLFSDYAAKQRFIYMPAGTHISADADGKLIFPVGTALIKSFGYPAQSGGLNVIETRILLHQAQGWVALPYVWRANGEDADLRVGGTRVPVTFAHGGNDVSVNYSVPNKNQCKQCHSAAGNIMPIGPVWQNMEFLRPADAQAIIKGAPSLTKLPPYPKWNDKRTGSLDDRARQYLKVNCGHCHAANGSASNSGLFLDGSANGAAALGIGKRPVAAGRASGDLDFIIAPGQPDQSILIKRMESTDPGIAMPELGRSTVHKEGVELLREWIAAMPSRTH
jgi:uncharacterized repeat protein (TIGR03806 family)